MADTNGRGGGSRGSASASRSQSQSQSRSPTVPPRAVRGLPDNFSRESGHPATSSGTRCGKERGWRTLSGGLFSVSIFIVLKVSGWVSSVNGVH